MENTYLSLLVVVILAITCSQAFPTQSAESDSNNGQKEVIMNFGMPVTAHIVSPDGTVTVKKGLKGIIFKKVNEINIIRPNQLPFTMADNPYGLPITLVDNPYGLPFTMEGLSTVPQTLMTPERRRQVDERINHLKNVCDNLSQQLMPLLEKETNSEETFSSVYPILNNVLTQKLQLHSQKKILDQFNYVTTSYYPKTDSFDADLDGISKKIDELVQRSKSFLQSVTTVSPVV